jgi:flagellar biosynthesis protein FlhB
VSERGDNDNKTEQPTQRRLEKAREEGLALRVHAVASAAVLFCGAAILSLAGARLIQHLELCLQRGLGIAAARLHDPGNLVAAAGTVVSPAVGIVALFSLAMAAVGVAAEMLVGGWSFSAQPLTPDFGRINPLHGLREMVSRTAWVEICKSLIKFAAVGAIAAFLIRGQAPDFIAAAAETWPRAAEHDATLWSRIFLVLSASLCGLAVLEVPYQVWAHRDRLKMTRQEIKDELRELDGNQQTKRRIKLLRRRMARMRMASEVPKADVVVTNPEHYAAALQYRDDKMRAPRLVAKGTGLVAQRIREIAIEHRVPVIAAPPLARAICRYVELDDEIPASLYPPVAEVLAYVYRLRAAAASGRPPPPAPQDERFAPPPEFSDRDRPPASR